MNSSFQAIYQQMITQQDYQSDPAQDEIVVELDRLYQLLHQARWRKIDAQGIYIWGAVGRGKTFLMDLFFETLPVKQKTRIHFHRMMADVHRRLKALDDVEDPLDKVAGDMAGQTQVLCFDEFFVSDIADAMILSRLLDGLFRRGVTLVATSNSPPAWSIW